MLAANAATDHPVDSSAADYAVVRRAIEFISEEWQSQPSLDAIAQHVGLTPMALHRLFTRWAGLTPKTFLQAVTLDHARSLLGESGSILEASHALGLSGPARLHDLFVTHDAMTPGDFKRGGAGAELHWGIHPSPFGLASVVEKDGRLAGLGFVDDDDGDPLDLFVTRWPAADFIHDPARTATLARRVFDRAEWSAGRPLRIVLIGTDFEIRVWEALLAVPFGRATSYSAVAAEIGRPKAARAVGGAISRNPISFVVPCHRVIGKGGGLTGYLWGLTRKRAILGWETGIAAAADDQPSISLAATEASALRR
jgi:AraC family transcriptional regulator of adaptative response/methylated-DNA-[protein]-cysteine methyltransferase